ncbi:MAG: protein translocase subunit SecF [Patescibacteria group bacterium]
MNIIFYRKYFLGISGILILASIVSVFVFGLKPGIDFVGGTLWQIKPIADSQQLTIGDFKAFLEKELLIKNFSVYSETESQSFLLRMNHISESEHQDYLVKVKLRFGDVEELRYETIGPTIGKELRTKAIWAIILVLFGISFYVAYAFRKVSYPIKSWKYGAITLITLFHDVIIPTGLLAVLGYFKGVELNTNFIVALLVIVGFSVHDTIVVFDRIRENLIISRDKLELKEIINQSINQTLARSINTSVTLVLVLMTLLLLGPESLKYFILIILVGVIIGTYSSIFIASPSLILIRGKKA